MGAWPGLVYNNGLIRCANTDWLEIGRLNLGDPEILEVNDGETVTPTKSFVQLERGTVPNISQCHTIGISGIASGTILIVRGLTSEIVSMLDAVGNLDIESVTFGLTTYSTMVLMRTSGWSEIARSDNN
jgi:hypothetical protein